MPNPNEQIIIGVLPTEGNITYDELKAALDTTGSRKALVAFQKGLIREQFEARFVDGAFRVARLGNFPAEVG